MATLSPQQYAEKHGVSKTIIQRFLDQGRIAGAVKIQINGRDLWTIPEKSAYPEKKVPGRKPIGDKPLRQRPKKSRS